MDSIESSLLYELKNADVNSREFISKYQIDDQQLMRCMQSMAASKYIAYEEDKLLSKVVWKLTDEGKDYLANGSPESQFYHAINVNGSPEDEIRKRISDKVFKIGVNKAIRNKWIRYDKTNKLYYNLIDQITDQVKITLKEIDNADINIVNQDIEELRKRNLIVKSAQKVYRITKGANFGQPHKKLATDLTADNMTNWTDQEFKEYNFNAKSSHSCGNLHPLMKVRAEFRSILLEMGFEEMETNNFVESSFWNFDALFQPQHHPARDAHDTFFLETPNTTLSIPEVYKDNVQQMHEQGGDGSIGYRYNWNLDVAKQNILRTHTTAVSARMIYKIAKEQKEFKPRRFFSIDRVFRNEKVDFTHLAEFHQVEGFIMDKGLTLGDLIGTIKIFCSKIGLNEVIFKPAYNPYTEPSMEIFAYSKELKKYIEIGNSGIFRPEMLLPTGLDKDVRVIAWGVGLERPTMIKYGIKNIRRMFGPQVKFANINRNPICRFD